MRPVQPISMISTGRPQEMGKIKLGKTIPLRSGGGSRPTSIETFRFVSRDQAAIDTLAELYGGTPQLKEGQYDLETTAKEIDVILPPDPLGGTPIYELWSGGGCQRRCDGIEATVPIRTGDDVSFTEQACICAAKEQMECKPTVRLSVILPSLTLGGVWNLKTNSWAAAREMQQMVSTIEMAQARGLIAATLAVEQREQTTAGKTKKFIVPILRLKATLAELASGGLPALPTVAPIAALPAPLASPEQRHLLNVAWKDADVDSRAEATAWMDARGVNPDTLTVAMIQPLLDLLVVHEPDVGY